MRRVSEEVWNLISSLFPKAIEYKVKADVPNKDLRCDECDDEEAHEGIFADKLRDWSKRVTSSPILKPIVNRKRTFEELEDRMCFECEDEEAATFHGGPADDLFLVHREDVDAWRAAVKAVKKHSGKSTSALTETLISSLFSGPLSDQEVVAMNSKLDVHSHMMQSFTSLFCDEHKLPLKRAVLNEEGTSLDTDTVGFLDNFVEALTASEYSAFIASIYDLGILLAHNTLDPEATNETGESVLQKSPRGMSTDNLRYLQEAFHPLLQNGMQKFANFSSTKFYAKGICRDEECNCKFDMEQQTRKKYPDEKDKGESSNVVNLVDDADDVTSGFSLRVFQIDEKADFDDAVSSILGLPKSTDSGNSTATDRAYGSLRRSNRKKKTTFPNGHILRQDSLDIRPHYNLAAVRMHLYEKHGSFPLDRELVLIVPRTSFQVESTDDGANNESQVVDMTMEEDSTSNSQDRYVAFPLAYEWNDKALEDAVEAAVGGTNDIPKSMLTEHLLPDIFLCWEEKTARKKKGAKKASEEEDQPLSQSTLMDLLLQTSNADEKESPTASTKKKKSTRRAERGFAGTLLHSTAPSNAEKAKTSDGDSSSNDGSEEKKEPTNQGCKDSPMSIDGDEKDKENKEKAAVKSDRKKKAESTPESTNKVFVVDDNDNNDDDVDNDRTLSQLGMERQSSKDESLSVLVSSTQAQTSRELRSSISDPMEESLVDSLIAFISGEVNETSSSRIQSLCRQAAKFALANAPGGAGFSTVEELMGVALDKFYDSYQ